MKGIKGLQIIKERFGLEFAPKTPQYKQIEAIAETFAEDADMNTGIGCPRCYGLSDPYTRETRKGYPAGKNVCMLIHLGSGCKACWTAALRETYHPELEQKCRVCGCTDSHACPGGCYWVEPDLCSRCAKAEQEAQKNG